MTYTRKQRSTIIVTVYLRELARKDQRDRKAEAPAAGARKPVLRENRATA